MVEKSVLPVAKQVTELTPPFPTDLIVKIVSQLKSVMFCQVRT